MTKFSAEFRKKFHDSIDAMLNQAEQGPMSTGFTMPDSSFGLANPKEHVPNICIFSIGPSAHMFAAVMNGIPPFVESAYAQILADVAKEAKEAVEKAAAEAATVPLMKGPKSLQ